jgi:hypothetical protein
MHYRNGFPCHVELNQSGDLLWCPSCGYERVLENCES